MADTILDRGRYECDTVRSRAQSHALIWRIHAELIRRYPELWVVPLGDYSLDEMYDEIIIVSDPISRPVKRILSANAAGSGLAVGDEVIRWTSAYAAGVDRPAWLDGLASMAKLPPRRRGLPASTTTSLAVRYVATFLSLQVGGRHDWVSGPGAGDAATQTHPGVREWQQEHEYIQDLVTVLHRDGESPELVVSPHGDLWRSTGEHYRLRSLHVDQSPVTTLLAKTLPDLLP